MSFDEQCVGTAFVQLVIELYDVSVQLRRNWRWKCESAKIEAVSAACISIWLRISLKNCKNVRIRTAAPWARIIWRGLAIGICRLQPGHRKGRQILTCRHLRIARHTEVCIRSTCDARGITYIARVLNDSRSQQRTRNYSGHLIGFIGPLPLVVGKEEEAVLDNGTAD